MQSSRMKELWQWNITVASIISIFAGVHLIGDPWTLGTNTCNGSKRIFISPHYMVSRSCLQRKQQQLYKWPFPIKQKDKKRIDKFIRGMSCVLTFRTWVSSGKAFLTSGFWRRPVSGKTNMLIDFTSCLSESSSGLNPNFDVHVSTSSVIAGMINFSTLRELRIWNRRQ
jgi:hypothetical protein